MSNFFKIVIIVLLFNSCQSEFDSTLFDKIVDSGIDFSNDLVYTEDFNPYLYRNFYNGGGVSCGDINNDGLIDIYFTGNQVDNKLYLNQGGMKFKDISETAGVHCHNVWSTGANMVDINADGLLDIYVCKGGDPTGPRRYNELFINNGDLTFTERSADYGLDIKGLSIQSAFLDYDRDGDLDCYILNNSIKPIGGNLDLKAGSRNIPSDDGNKFMRNDNGVFTDVAEEVGIYNSEIGFGLGITISDFNDDSWPDIYISNDFFEKDYLYINQQDGTFSEEGDRYFDCLPMGAMGADAADLNNDTYTDLMVTEMLPRSLKRKKTKAIYESWKKYNLAVEEGFAHQFSRNTLQLNNGGNHFSEIGRMSNVNATDWSWSCLIQDFDNNGWKEIYITNGIYKDLLDRDYLGFIADKERVGSMIKQNEKVITSLIDSMPTIPLSNHMYTLTDSLRYTDTAEAWGIANPGFSNGCAYADLDNDGDLDLVVNNVNAESDIYQNNTQNSNHFVALDLSGLIGNTKAIGASVTVHCPRQSFKQELYPSRGFQSSVPHRLHFGLGSNTQIDSLLILWPNGVKKYYDINVVDSLYSIKYSDGRSTNLTSNKQKFKIKIDTLHSEAKVNRYDQFDRDKLIYRMNPKCSPVISKIPNSNSYVYGGAKLANSKVISFSDEDVSTIQELENTSQSEVNEVLHLDYDNDGDLDIYMACGGSAYGSTSPDLHDKLFENQNGKYIDISNKLNFTKAIATSSAVTLDFDSDGFMDLLLADSKYNQPYGNTGSIHLLKNISGDEYRLQTISGLEDLGIITDIEMLDIDQDGNSELVVVGEWMDIMVYDLSHNSATKKTTHFTKQDSKGIWSLIYTQDLNKDGIDDILFGNCGDNTALDETYTLVLDDIDQNGRIDQVLCKNDNGRLYPVLDKDDLTAVFPQINKKYLKYHDYANAGISDLFGKENLEDAKYLDLNSTKSELHISTVDGFNKVQLPEQVQFSSLFTALYHDIDNDGTSELLFAGNHYNVKPQFGREDASRVWCISLEGKGNDLKVKNIESLGIKGQIRSMVGTEDGFIFTTAAEQILRCRVL